MEELSKVRFDALALVLLDRSAQKLNRSALDEPGAMLIGIT